MNSFLYKVRRFLCAIVTISLGDVLQDFQKLFPTSACHLWYVTVRHAYSSKASPTLFVFMFFVD